MPTSLGRASLLKASVGLLMKDAAAKPFAVVDRHGVSRRDHRESRAWVLDFGELIPEPYGGVATRGRCRYAFCNGLESSLKGRAA